MLSSIRIKLLPIIFTNSKCQRVGSIPKKIFTIGLWQQTLGSNLYDLLMLVRVGVQPRTANSKPPRHSNKIAAVPERAELLIGRVRGGFAAAASERPCQCRFLTTAEWKFKDLLAPGRRALPRWCTRAALFALIPSGAAVAAWASTMCIRSHQSAFIWIFGSARSESRVPMQTWWTQPVYIHVCAESHSV